MTTALPTLFTQRPNALLLEQWATPSGLPHRAAPSNSLDADFFRWHLPAVALVDIADLDLLADHYGDRSRNGYTIAVGTGDEEETQLREAVALAHVDLGARVDLLPQRRALTVILDKTRIWTPDQLRYAIASAARDAIGAPTGRHAQPRR